MKIKFNTLFIFALMAAIIGPVVAFGGSYIRLHDIPFLIVLITAFSTHKLFIIPYKWIFPMIIFFIFMSILYGYYFLGVKSDYHDFIRLPRYLIYWSAFYIGNNVTINKKFINRLINASLLIIVVVFSIMIIQLFNIPVLEELVRIIYKQEIDSALQGIGIYADILYKRPAGPLGNSNALNF